MVDLVNLLEREKASGKPGRIGQPLLPTYQGILDALGYLPFRHAGGALLLQLLSARCEHTSLGITTDLSLPAWSSLVVDVKMTTAL